MKGTSNEWSSNPLTCWTVGQQRRSALQEADEGHGLVPMIPKDQDLLTLVPEGKRG